MSSSDISVAPNTLKMPKNGGSAKVEITNNTERRLSWKIRTTDDEYFRVKPVYSFLEPKEKKSLEIMRIPGKSGKDKLKILFIDAKDDEEPSAPFKAGCLGNTVEVTVEVA